MSRRISNRRILAVNAVADLAAIVAAYYSAIAFRFHSGFGGRLVLWLNTALRVPRFETAHDGMSFETFYLVSAPRIIALLAVTVFVFYVGMDLYAARRLLIRRFFAGDVARANFYALLFFFVYFYLSRNQFHPRSMFAIIMGFNTLYTLFFRSMAHRGLRALRERTGVDQCPVLAAGATAVMTTLADWIDETKPQGLTVQHRMALRPGDLDDAQLEALRCAIEQSQVAMLVLADPDLSIQSVMQVIEMTDSMGLPVKILSPALEVIGARSGLRVDRALGMPLVHFEPSPRSTTYYLLKRFYSAGLAGLAMLVLWPVMLLIALAIRCSSIGPIMFVQERIGVNRTPFRMYKFRTMYQYAEEMQAQVEAFNESGQGLFKIRRDPRVTPVGRFLRRFSLDELPQLFNVIKGDMTLVGPRPLPRRDLDHYYEDWHYIRHGGMPGLTCLWQVAGRSELDFHSMCLMDTYYLRNQTLALDARILARTVWAVLFARGAY